MAYIIGDNCTGCGTCVDECPSEAISGDDGQKHSIDADLCVDCGTCEEVCPEDPPAPKEEE